MKKAARALAAQLLVTLAVPARGLPGAKTGPLPRTAPSFDKTDQNKDGVISRREFLLNHAPAPATAPMPVFAAAPMPAVAETTKPAPKGLEPMTTTPEPTEKHLTWPKDVEPGHHDTVKNVSVHPETNEVVGVWHTANVTMWDDGAAPSKHADEEMDKASKEIGRAVDEAAKPPPAVQMDDPATAAAKNALDKHGDNETIAAAAAGASGAALPSATLTFEMKNINYYMLDEPAHHNPAITHHPMQPGGGFTLVAQSGTLLNHRTPTLETGTPKLEEDAIKHDETLAEVIEKSIKETMEQLMAIAFGQVGSIESRDDLHDDDRAQVTIGHTILALQEGQGLPPVAAAQSSLAPAPAPALAPAHVQAWSPGPQPLLPKEKEAPTEAPTALEKHLPKMAVTLLPGRSVQGTHNEEELDEEHVDTSSVVGGTVALHAHSLGRRNFRGRASRKAATHRAHVDELTTIAKVEMVESAEKPAFEIENVRKAVGMYIMDGTLSSAVSASITDNINMQPKIGVIEEKAETIKPYDVSACASHIHKLVDDFSRAYSRHEVVPALYSACTHYGQKLSFSHDEIIDKSDQHKCRRATKRFSKLWQYGKGKVDYGRFCLELCELRHGQDSIQCDAYKHFVSQG